MDTGKSLETHVHSCTPKLESQLRYYTIYYTIVIYYICERTLDAGRPRLQPVPSQFSTTCFVLAKKNENINRFFKFMTVLRFLSDGHRNEQILHQLKSYQENKIRFMILNGYIPSRTRELQLIIKVVWLFAREPRTRFSALPSRANVRKFSFPH